EFDCNSLWRSYLQSDFIDQLMCCFHSAVPFLALPRTRAATPILGGISPLAPSPNRHLCPLVAQARLPAGGSSPIPNPAPSASTFGGPRQAHGPSRRNKNASAREGRDGSRTVPTARSRYAALRGLLNRLHGTKEICAPSRPQGILCHPKANLAILRTFGERANLVTLGETSRGKDPTAWLGWDCVILARMSRN